MIQSFCCWCGTQIEHACPPEALWTGLGQYCTMCGEKLPGVTSGGGHTCLSPKATL